MLACAQQPLASTPEGQSLATQGLKCPRCDSSDTKFCYYNNYSTTQPRYFCKNCKRYWTEGGSLRNVPVGGGLRKNKKKKMNSSPSPSYGPPSKHQKTNASHGKGRSYANPDPNLHSEDSGYIRNPMSVRSINGSPSSSDPQDASSLNYPINSYPFDLRVYEAGDEASLGSTMQTQFAEGGLFPGYFTGYGYNSEMEGLPQGDFGYGSYKALGSSSSDQGQSSSGELAREPSEVGSEGLNTQPGSKISTVSLNAKQYEQGQQPNEAVCGDLVKANDQGDHSQPQHVHTVDEEGKRHATNGDDHFQPSSTDGTLYERGDCTAATEASHVDVDLDEAFSNVVSVSYPFDWQQVSECLFGGPGDFVYYVVPAGAGGNLSSFDTGAT